MTSLKQAVIEIVERDVHRALLCGLQAHVHLTNMFPRRRLQREVNICHPAVWQRLRMEPGLLPHQADEDDISRAVTKLIAMGAIGVPGWNARSRLPPINGAACVRVRLF